jgi:hypothetical protein
MMPRWIWFAPFGVLVVALGAWAFRLGWIAATITETDVIEAWTEHYLAAQPGARATDCMAQPGRSEAVWVLVSCIHGDGRRFDFPVDRMGRLLDVSGRPDAPGVPET